MFYGLKEATKRKIDVGVVSFSIIIIIAATLYALINVL